MSGPQRGGWMRPHRPAQAVLFLVQALPMVVARSQEGGQAWHSASALSDDAIGRKKKRGVEDVATCGAVARGVVDGAGASAEQDEEEMVGSVGKAAWLRLQWSSFPWERFGLTRLLTTGLQLEKWTERSCAQPRQCAKQL